MQASLGVQLSSSPSGRQWPAPRAPEGSVRPLGVLDSLLRLQTTTPKGVRGRETGKSGERNTGLG